ncbi:MAG: glutathione S-transferase family protein [Methyloligellaceae bacterium]
MFTIYGRANSSNVRKVLWLLAELGIDDYERLDYGRGYTPCDTPEYLALNPNKVVPTLVDGDLVIWESNAILRYLATKHGTKEIYPTELVARTRVEQWLDWQLTTAITGIRNLFQGLHVKDPAFTDPAGLEKAQAQATGAMGILDDHLRTQAGYIVGDALTIADCALAMYVHRWYALPIERKDFTSLAAYYELLKEREPFQTWIVGQGV